MTRQFHILAITFVFLGSFQQKRSGTILGVANGQNCYGKAAADGGCIMQLGPKNCRGFTGCEWNVVMGRCQGYPTRCEDIQDCVFCKNHGSCSWYDTSKSGEDARVCVTKPPTKAPVTNFNPKISNVEGVANNTSATYHRKDFDDDDNIGPIVEEEIIPMDPDLIDYIESDKREEDDQSLIDKIFDVDKWDDRILGSDAKTNNYVHVIQMIVVSIITTIILFT